MKINTLPLMLLSLTGLLLIGLGTACYLWGYRLNTSTSYPTGVYLLSHETATYNTGELVLFCPPDNAVMQQALERDYIKSGRCPGGFMPVIKRIMAISDDTVSFDNGMVHINGRRIPHATQLAADNQGRPLPRYAPITLAHDQLFMMSDHRPDVSFDSRYYGPVPVDNVIGHIQPVFTW